MILEEVLLITAGIIILLGITSISYLAKDQISTNIQKIQREKINNYIKSNIDTLIQNNINGQIKLKIPKKINNEYYLISNHIEGTNNYLSLIFKDTHHNTEINSKINGIITSETGTITIKYDTSKKITYLESGI
jgi:hypothetical protein